MVYDVAKRYVALEQFKKKDSLARKKHVRKKTTRTPELIQRAQELILEDPGTLIRKLAAVLKETRKKYFIYNYIKLYIILYSCI